MDIAELDAELAFDDFANPLERPQFGTEAMGLRALALSLSAAA